MMRMFRARHASGNKSRTRISVGGTPSFGTGIYKKISRVNDMRHIVRNITNRHFVEKADA